ncbi:hypothetical protein ILYODFUR_016964, partial [Ilyodon furcidens]
LFGVTGNCAACSKLIPAFEMVMRAKENVYHLDCFACQLCNQRSKDRELVQGIQDRVEAPRYEIPSCKQLATDQPWGQLIDEAVIQSHHLVLFPPKELEATEELEGEG